MNLERTWTAGPANVFGFWARALNPSPAFWLAMFVASAFGTVLGDFWAAVDGVLKERGVFP